MPRFAAVGLVVPAAAAALLLAPAAHAAQPSATPSPVRPRVQLPRVPILEASPVPSSTAGRGDDIQVPAGKADVSAPGHTNDIALVALAGGGALLLAGGTVVAVSRRRV